MALLVVGLILFLGIHLLPALRGRRADFVERLGAGGYKLFFTAVSLAGFALIIYGYGVAREAGSPLLYDPPIWARHLSLLLMVPVFVLLVATYLPTGHIKKRAKHPMILAVKIWALAHLIANGDVASVTLFAAFLAWGVIDRISLKRRGDLGGGAAATVQASSDAIALAVGLALYAGFVLWLHEWLIGVPVM